MKAGYIKTWLEYLERPLATYASEMTISVGEVAYYGKLNEQNFGGVAHIRIDGEILYSLSTDNRHDLNLVHAMKREYRRILKIESALKQSI